MSHALVTGANRGLGLEFTRQLLANGWHVIATCRDPRGADELTELATGHSERLQVRALELADPRSIAALAAELERIALSIDLLINNAGWLPRGERFGSLAPEALREAFAINALGPLLLTQALAPQLAEGARVVNLSSRLGSIALTESFHTPSYAIAKAALNMATRLLAQALAPCGIMVVAVSPGWVRTSMGGADAPTLPAEAVAAILTLAARLGPADSGTFLGSDGQPIPW